MSYLVHMPTNQSARRARGAVTTAVTMRTRAFDTIGSFGHDNSFGHENPEAVDLRLFLQAVLVKAVTT